MFVLMAQGLWAEIWLWYFTAEEEAIDHAIQFVNICKITKCSFADSMSVLQAIEN